MVSSTPLPLFTPGKDPAPILQEAGWAGLDGQKISSPPGFDPGPSNLYSFCIQELLGQILRIHIFT